MANEVIKLKAIKKNAAGEILSENKFTPAIGSPIDEHWRFSPIVRTTWDHEDGTTVIHERDTDA